MFHWTGVSKWNQLPLLTLDFGSSFTQAIIYVNTFNKINLQISFGQLPRGYGLGVWVGDGEKYLPSELR